MRQKSYQLVHMIFGELVRYWVVSCLLYFIAISAELAWFKLMLEVYILGLPIALTSGFTVIVAAALSVFILNRWHWQRPVYYVGFGEDQMRIRRLSLTDVRPSELDFLQYYHDARHSEASIR